MEEKCRLAYEVIYAAACRYIICISNLFGFFAQFFSKSFCPFCKKTKKLFNTLGVEATIYELNEMDESWENDEGR